MKNMLLCRIEFHTTMEMRHDRKVTTPYCRLSVCIKFISNRVMESLFMCANSDNTIIANMLEIFAVATYRLLVKLDVTLRNFILLILVQELPQFIPNTLHNTNSHICFCFAV